MEDRDIIDAMKIDKNKGMKLLLDKYTGLVYHIVKNRVYNLTDAEDVTSEIFIEIFEKWESIDIEKGTIKSFLGTVATRRSIDWLRKKKEEVELNEDIVFEGEDILDSLIKKEEKEVVLSLLNELKEPDKSFVISRYFFNTSSKELAIQFNMTANSIDKRISRAIEFLRNKREEILS